MKTFEERAGEWMKKVGWSSHTTQHGAVVLFARHLDQEAPEKPQQPECEHGVDTDITARKSYQPQQPEEIKWEHEAHGDHSGSHQLSTLGKLNENIVNIGKILNRLTHKD